MVSEADTPAPPPLPLCLFVVLNSTGPLATFLPWRPTVKMSENVANEYGRLLRKRLGPHVSRIVLFGSRARGDASDHSDYDFLVVVDRRTRDVREAILDVGAEMLNRYDHLFAALTYTDEEWREAIRFPLGWNIEREGIAV